MMIHGKKSICVAVILIAAVTTGALAEEPYEVEWKRQIGTSVFDRSDSVALDAFGNAYITGYTRGDLGGSNAGGDDAFLSKFDSAGNELWTSQIGSTEQDLSYSVAVDASGNVYISGNTTGDLGGPNAGFYDAFLSKFDSSGNEAWTTQIGTKQWDRSSSVAVDASGDIYISGRTTGDLGGSRIGWQDAFLSKFDPEGHELWTTQIGTIYDDKSNAVAVDASGNVYISGSNQDDPSGPSAGDIDVFLSKLDSDGNELWTTQIGSSDRDGSSSVAVDASGNVYISGSTSGDLGGPNAGDWDAFLVKYEVPEPATLGMLTLGGLAILRRRRNC